MDNGLKLAHRAIDILCPMHVKMDEIGKIIHVGPTMRKMRPCDMVGKPFWQFFELIRPKLITSVEQAVALNG